MINHYILEPDAWHGQFILVTATCKQDQENQDGADNTSHGGVRIDQMIQVTKERNG